MPEQDIQIGSGTMMGIEGAITLTPTVGSAVANGSANFSGVTQTTNFTMDELANSGGTFIESVIASKCYKDTRVDFIPKGTTRANAETVFDAVDAWTPLIPVTIASATASTLNVAGNLISGVEKGFTRDGRATISFTIRSYQKSDGTYGALSVVSG